MDATLVPLESAAQVRDFVFAGHALFTVQSGTGAHLTYRVSRARRKGTGDDERRPWFVRTASGEERYIGCVWPRPVGWEFVPARQVDPSAVEIRAFRWLVAQLALGEAGSLLRQARVLHHGTCGRCGLELTHPDSIASGIGPDCAKKLGIKIQRAAKAA